MATMGLASASMQRRDEYMKNNEFETVGYEKCSAKALSAPCGSHQYIFEITIQSGELTFGSLPPDAVGVWS